MNCEEEYSQICKTICIEYLAETISKSEMMCCMCVVEVDVFVHVLCYVDGYVPATTKQSSWISVAMTTT